MNASNLSQLAETMVMYASPLTARMARQSLLKAKPHNNNTTRIYVTTRKCACGTKLPHVSKMRNNEKVCDICAAKTPRKHGGQKAKTKCAKCKTVGSSLFMKMVNKQFYCKTCAPTIKKNPYKRNI